MKAEYLSYLNAISAGQALIERVELSVVIFDYLCPEPIESIFVNDRINRDTGDRNFSSVWGFSGTYWLSTRNILTETNADIAPYDQSIWYLSVDYQDLVISEGVPTSSRLFVEVSTGRLEKNELSATGPNCPFLWRIVSELFRPNLKTELA